MKCPNCNYRHGFDNSIMHSVEGEEGPFFTLSANAIWENEQEIVYACPKCGYMFIVTYENQREQPTTQ